MKTEHWLAECAKHCRRFTKAWDYYLVAGDAFRAAYVEARKETGNPQLGKQEVDFPEETDGTHQLTTRTFAIRNEENYNLPFNELLKTYIPMVEFDDIRVVEKDGIISFQGMGKRVKL